MRDNVYYVGVILTLIALCCEYSTFMVVMLVVGFCMVLAGYVK